MIKRDYHLWKLEDAIRDVEHLIDRARMNKPIEVELITGNGVIKSQLFHLFVEYGLEAKEKLGNPGVIIAYLE